MRLQVELESAEAADDVLRRVGPVDPEDQPLGAPLDDLPLSLEHGLAGRELVELLGVDRDRRRDDARPTLQVFGRPEPEVPLGAEHVDGAAQEGEPPAVRVEADDVVCEEPVVDREPHVRRQDPPVVGLRPRDVHEVRQHRVGRRLPDEPRREVEVVVVKKNGRVRLGLEFLEHGVGEALVDADVPLLPRVPHGVIDGRRVRELPQVVLEKPEDRICDDVVEPVVLALVVSHQPESKLRAVPRGFLDRLRGSDAVLVADRTGDPGDVVMRDQPAQGRDEAAAPAPRHPLAVLATVRDRAAVRHDDQLAPFRHGADTLTARCGPTTRRRRRRRARRPRCRFRAID